MSDEWKDIFQSLRASFESTAQNSKGLYHAMVEMRRDESMATTDANTPNFVKMQWREPTVWSVLSFQTLLGDPMRPRKLSEEEIQASPPPKDGDGYIRDANHRALAKWTLPIIRSGYLCGFDAALPQFKSVADAAGRAFLTIPKDVCEKLPEDIRECFPERRAYGRRYVFGKVENMPAPFYSRGWAAGILAYPEGVVVDSPEPHTGNDDGMSCWILFLHRLGWRANPGDPVTAIRYLWKANHSMTLGAQDPVALVKDMEKDAHFPKDMPTNRFVSIIGASDSRPTDLCFASAWAIDKLFRIVAQ
jgi:hypothetical protein